MVAGLEYGLKSGSPVLESVLEYRTAVLGLAVLELGLDMRLSVLRLDSYSAKAVLVPSLIGCVPVIYCVTGVVVCKFTTYSSTKFVPRRPT